MKKFPILVAVGICVLSTAGCRLFAPPPPPRVQPTMIVPGVQESENYERPTKSSIRDEYILAPTDVIEIIVRGHNDLSGRHLIRPDGKITMHLLDDIAVEGLTPAQVDDLVTEKLKQYLKEVNVSVSVVAFNSKQVHFIGPAGNAVQLPYTGEMTVLDLITRIGGLPQISAPENAVVVRGDLDQPEIIKVNMKDIIYRGDNKDNILLRENDIVILPANFFSKVNLVVSNLLRATNTPASLTSSARGNLSSLRTLMTETERWRMGTYHFDSLDDDSVNQ